MIKSDWLRSYIAFAEDLNFTRAAARLHISQPALHVQIAKLSEAVGATLYLRTGRALALTEQGRRVLAFARELEERTESFLAGMSGQPRDTVVLAAGEGTLLYVLGPAVRRMSQRTEVKVRALTRDGAGTLAALAAGEAHLGVAALDAVPEHVTARLLRRVGMSLVMPRDHRLSRKRRVRLRDLHGERLIVPPAERPHRQQLARALAAQGVRWELAVEASGWELMLEYARLGVGLAVVNDICRTPRGTVMRPIPELSPVHYHVLHRSERKLSAAAEALRALIIEAFAPEERAARGG